MSSSALANVSNVANAKGPTRRRSVAPGKEPVKEEVSTEKRLRRKSSLAPAAMAGGADDSMSMSRRQSMSGRRMSMGPAQAAPAQPKRNFSDKAVMVHNQRRLLLFLQVHGYEDISAKQLETPSRKDFVSILQFLAVRVLPDHPLEENQNLGKQMVLLFKTLSYPYTLSPSAVQSVGAPHTWGLLLGALVWLTELITYEEMLAQREIDMQQSESNDMVMFRFLAEAYRYFMTDDPRLQDLDRQMEATATSSCEELRKQIIALEANCSAHSTTLETLQAEKSPLERSKAKLADLNSDVEKFTDYLSKLEQVRGTCEEKLAEEAAETAALAREFDALCAERERLAAELAAQDLSPEDVERLTKTRSNLDSLHKSLLSQKEALQQSKWEQETRTSRQLDEVEACVHAYNKLGTETRLIPASAKYAAGRDFELAFHVNGQTVEDMLGADLKGTLKPAFRALKAALLEKYKAKQGELAQLKERADLAEEAKADKRDDVAALGAQLQKMEAEMAEAKRAGDEEIRARAAEAEALVGAAVRLRGELQTSLQTSQKSLELVQKDAEDMARELEREKSSAQNLLVDILGVLMDHKQAVSQELAALERAVAAISQAQNGANASLNLSLNTLQK